VQYLHLHQYVHNCTLRLHRGLRMACSTALPKPGYVMHPDKTHGTCAPSCREFVHCSTHPPLPVQRRNGRGGRLTNVTHFNGGYNNQLDPPQPFRFGPTCRFLLPNPRATAIDCCTILLAYSSSRLLHLQVYVITGHWRTICSIVRQNAMHCSRTRHLLCQGAAPTNVCTMISTTGDRHPGTKLRHCAKVPNHPLVPVMVVHGRAMLMVCWSG
jgi:hypothetical protein